MRNNCLCVIITCVNMLFYLKMFLPTLFGNFLEPLSINIKSLSKVCPNTPWLFSFPKSIKFEFHFQILLSHVRKRVNFSSQIKNRFKPVKLCKTWILLREIHRQNFKTRSPFLRYSIFSNSYEEIRVTSQPKIKVR